jgi:hypothetical protein
MKRSILTFFFVSVVLIGCIPPLTKESYLTKYEHFVSQVREGRTNPSFSWDKKDNEYEKYSQTYYHRFEKDMNFSEKILCQKLRIEYLIMRTQNELRSTVENVFHDDLKRMYDRIENYIENDLTCDLQSLIKEVDSTTKSAFDALKQALQTMRGNGSSPGP